MINHTVCKATIPKKACIYYGDNAIDFTIQAAQVGSNKIRIKVYADQRVIVQAPTETDYAEIIEATEKRARWIYQQLTVFAKYRANLLPRLYVSGESHFYLGRQHMLKILLNTDTTPPVKLLQGVLQISTNTNNVEKIHALLMSWYKQRAMVVFNRRLDQLLDRLYWLTKKTILHYV